MIFDEFRIEMNAWWKRLDSRSEELRDPMVPLAKLRVWYSGLNSEDREFANRVISENVLSDDDRIVYDAMALTREFRIAESVPSLRERVRRLTSKYDAPAMGEMKMTVDLLDELWSLGVGRTRSD